MIKPEETLIIVSADHSHGLTINGVQARGLPINGFAGSDSDKIPFTSLMYSNGPGFMTQEEREKRGQVDDFRKKKFNFIDQLID